MSLLGWLGRQASGVYHQVDPWDNGQTYNTVTQNRVPGSNVPAPAPAPAPAPQPNQAPNLVSRAWDQINPFDNGRTWQNPTPQVTNPNVNGSFLHQLTHNGITNAAGDVVKSFTNVAAAPIDMGAGLYQQYIQHDPNAAVNDYNKSLNNARNNLVTMLAKQIGGTGQALYDVIGRQGAATLTGNQTASDNATTAAVRDFNKTPFGQILEPVQQKAAEYQVHRDLKNLTPGQQKQAIAQNKSSVGLDPNASLGKQTLDSALAAAQLYGTAKAPAAADKVSQMAKIGSQKIGQASDAVVNEATKLAPSNVIAQAAKTDGEWNYWNNRYAYANDQATVAKTAAERQQWNDAATQMALNRNARLHEIGQGGYVKVPGGGKTPPEPTPPEVPTPKGPTRGTIKTLKQSSEVSPETAALLEGSPLTRRPHAPMREEAQAAVAKDLNAATNKALKDLSQTPGRMTDAQQMHAIKVAQAHDAMGHNEIASELYNKLATHRSRNAQAMAVGQELSRRTPDGIRYAAQRVLEKNGVKFEGDVAAKVNSLMQDIRGTGASSAEREIATQKLVHEVNNMIPRSKAQAVVDFWRAGLLTGPETVAKVAVSHAIVTPMELAVRPLAAATDAAVSHLPKNLLGFLTRNDKSAVAPGARTVTFNPMDYYKGTKGAIEGTKSAYTHLKTGIDEPNTGGFVHDLGVGHHQTPYEAAVYRVHGSVYKGPYRMGYRIEEANQARLAKDMFGNNAEKINKYMASDKAQSAMADYASQFAMQNKTEAGNLAQTIQHFKPGGVPIGEWIAPFTRIPAAIGVKGIVDYTPVGTARALKTVYDGIVKGTFDQRKFSETLSKSAGGGTALVGGGMMLEANGRLTLQEPNDPKDKELWRLEGKVRNSMYVGGKVTKDSNGVSHYSGGRWVSLNAMGPVGIAIGIGGAFNRALNGGSDGTNAVAQAIGAGGKLLAEQPYMKGVTGVGNVLQDPVRYAASYLRNSVTSFVPAGIQQTARGTDSQQRAYPDNMKDAIKQAFPITRESTPAQNDIFGSTVKGQAAESGHAAGIVNPFYPSTSKNSNDPAVTELQRLYNVLGGKSVAIQPTTTYSMKDANGSPKTVKLTTQQTQQMVKDLGQPIHDAVASAISNPQYQSMNDTDKVKALNDIFNAFQGQYVKINFNPNQKVTNAQTKLMTSDLSTSNIGPKTKSTTTKTTTTKKVSSKKVSGGGTSSRTALSKAYSAAGITGSNPYGVKLDTKPMRSLLTRTFKAPKTVSPTAFKIGASRKPVLISAGKTKVTKGRRLA